jgi:hypothetical protein
VAELEQVCLVAELEQVCLVAELEQVYLNRVIVWLVSEYSVATVLYGWTYNLLSFSISIV